MGMGGSIRAGSAFVELFLHDNKFNRGLSLARKKLQRFGASVRSLGAGMMKLGAVGLGGFALAAKTFSTMGDEVAKMSKRTGVAVESLSALAFVASQTGTDFKTLENGLRKMQRSIVDGERGLTTVTDAYDMLGITVADLEGKSPEDQFLLLGSAISELEDPTKRAAVSMMLFGRTGTNLLPMFENGVDGIQKLMDRANELGIVMSSEDAAAAEKFTDQLDELWKTVKMGIFLVGASLGPALGELSEHITKIASSTLKWINENRELVVSIFKGVLAFTAIGGALFAAGAALGVMGAILGGIVTGITALGTIIGIVGSILSAFAAVPIGLVIAAALGAGGAIYALADKFKWLKDIALSVWGGIKDAFAAGDIKLAAEILWAGLKLVWITGVQGLIQTWLKFKTQFSEIASTLFWGVAAMVIEVVASFKNAWADSLAYVTNLMDSWFDFAAKGMLHVQGVFDKDLNVAEAIEGLEQSATARTTKTERERKDALSRIELEKEKSMAKLDVGGQGKRAKENKEDLARSQDVVRVAEEKLANAIKRAAEARKAADEEAAKKKKEREKDGKKTRDKKDRDVLPSPGLAAAAEEEEGRRGKDVVGTFSARALTGLGFGQNKVEERIADASEKNTGLLKDIKTNTAEAATFGP